MEGFSGSPRLSSTSAGPEVEQQRSESSDWGRSSGYLPPEHPISQLQGAFEESIYEASQGKGIDWVVDLDAQSRRRDLLERPQYERLCGRKWRQRPDERYHPFWKLSAQMSFGLHLLVQEKAKSDAAVLNILQAHVDQMDGFVSRTTEDFLIIQIDIRTRIQYLSLPLENLDDFDDMLVDRNFRLAMIDYNGKIERAIERFTMAIDDSLKDIQKGQEAIGGLWQYLGQSAKENAPLSGNLTAIYNSMLGNTEGWNSAFSKLRRKGVALQYAITQLSRAIIEMQRRVGVASRKDVVSFVQPQHPTPRISSFRGLFERGMSVSIPNSSPALEKPLPSDPVLGKKSSLRPRTSVRGAGRLAHQKSVPNLRATMTVGSGCLNEPVSDRARSVNGVPSKDSDSGSIFPRLSKTISRRLSRAKLTPRVADDIVEDAPFRPSTSKTMKSFRKGKHVQHPRQRQQGPAQEPAQEPQPHSSTTKRPNTSSALAKGEAMRDQLLQYFKSDRVLDVWESVMEKERKTDLTDSRKDGLWSKFQVKSSGMRSDDLSTDLLSRDDIQKQMTWLDEESKNLNIYPLKPRPGAAPKFHTILEHISLQEHPKEEELRYVDADYSLALETDESIITALPAFPLPRIGRHAPHSPEILS